MRTGEVIDILELNDYVSLMDRSLDKKLVGYVNVFRDDYQIEVMENFIEDISRYEVYMVIDDGNNATSGLLHRTCRSKFMAKRYFEYLVRLANYRNIKYIVKKIKK